MLGERESPVTYITPRVRPAWQCSVECRARPPLPPIHGDKRELDSPTLIAAPFNQKRSPLMTELNSGEHPLVQTVKQDDGYITKLTGRMGGASLALTVLAFSAPLSVVSGFIPLTIMFGGEGAPLGFVVATAILLLFSIGYVTMTKHVPKPGAFYAFISMGLGKATGLGAAFLAVLSYLLVYAGNYAWFGISVGALVESLGGPATVWWLWALVGWAGVSILGYFNIELSAKVLTTVMALEVALVMVVNAFVLAKGGTEGLSAEPFSPAKFLEGNFGVTMLFAILVFMGFEATALFRDEVRNPGKVIPRATFGAVIFVGILYTVSTYALVTAFGSDAVTVSTETPTEMFPIAISQYVASSLVPIAFVLISTSVIAASLSIHNVIARYIYNLACDRALPHTLAKVHGKHHSPHRASNGLALLTGVIMALMAVLPLDEMLLYAQLIGIGSVGVLSLMAIVCVSVIAWFLARGSSIRENSFKTYMAPGVAGLSLVAVVVFACLNLDLLVGGEPGQYNWLLIPLAVVFIAGISVALNFRRSKPGLYQRLGRSESSSLGSGE